MSNDFFQQNNITHIDYKDTDILRKFIGPTGKIIPHKKSGVISKNQRKLAMAIKRARFMGLLPFIAR
ncbi:MAG: 30S ribosomal protein S18 [Candidatus Nomurabacteria bacterium GW2011_GWB1_37_5]|uniref:Small ribosomal subunit protein bS18 n=1 Tax=Candidatus Nomurabacteria bacterium GW2011_GWB1_37_5 TaxID=1618742 RepID=A0A0G0GZJ6_9BACT|nr:MAG: 30S ribosomal protein S18 [Candidatus Nomurabacteria bacterium GW2011_GWB1_37_5]